MRRSPKTTTHDSNSMKSIGLFVSDAFLFPYVSGTTWNRWNDATFYSYINKILCCSTCSTQKRVTSSIKLELFKQVEQLEQLEQGFKKGVNKNVKGVFYSVIRGYIHKNDFVVPLGTTFCPDKSCALRADFFGLFLCYI